MVQMGWVDMWPDWLISVLHGTFHGIPEYYMVRDGMGWDGTDKWDPLVQECTVWYISHWTPVYHIVELV